MSPSIKNTSRKNLVRKQTFSTMKAAKTTMHTGREGAVIGEQGISKESGFNDNFGFKRDPLTHAFKTGDGQLTTSKSKVNTLSYENGSNEALGPDDELKINDKSSLQDD